MFNRVINFILLICLINNFSLADYLANFDLLNIKDTLIEKTARKYVNFDLPDSPAKLVCIQFRYLTTDSNEAALLKLYLVKKKTIKAEDEVELNERLWSSKLLFNKQRIDEELSIDFNILGDNVRDYQIQFRLPNNENKQLSIDDVLDSVRIINDTCSSRYKCIKIDCLWGTFKDQTQEKNIIKLSKKNLINQTQIIQNQIQKLNLDLDSNTNTIFLIHNENKLKLNETIYSPVLKPFINLDEIFIEFDCKSLNTQCAPNQNIELGYKYVSEFVDLHSNKRFKLTKFDKLLSYKTKFTNEKVDKFVFKLNGGDLIAKQIDIVFWITIRLKKNQTMALSNIEVKHSFKKNLDWLKCNFELNKHRNEQNNLTCNLEQYNSFYTDKLLNWSIINHDQESPISNYIQLSNDQNSSSTYSPNELYLPRTFLEGDNRDCIFKFKFKFNTINLRDVNLFVYFVDDHKRSIKIWEKNEDLLMLKNVEHSNWTDVSIYMGKINKGFRLSFNTDQLMENSSIAIGDLEFENCHITNKTKRRSELDIIRVSYEEPKSIIENEQSVYKCDFEHIRTTLEQCELYQDELLEETCIDSYCTASEFLRSLDNFDGMFDLGLPFRDHSKNFNINGHYLYLQNMNSNGKITKAILRLKLTISNRLEYIDQNLSNKIDENSKPCTFNFYLRTNGYSLINYDIFVHLLTSNRLMSVRKKELKFSKSNFYELNQISFDNITEPFQILMQGSIKHNFLDLNTFIYIAIDDLSLTKDCLIL